MSRLITCPQGHQWELPETGEGSTTGLQVLCPVCGAAVDLSHSIPPEGAPTGVYMTGSNVETLPPPAAQPELSEPLVEEPAPPAIPGYEILDELGRGGMGRVYRARQSKLDRLVALKILPPDTGRDSNFAERFNREARSLAKLNHANIVTVYDFGQSEGLSYFVMEYVDGVNLRQLLKSGTLSPRETLQIMGQVCDALQYAHDEGIVHRDIKPENILRDKRGRVKVADFGIAKLLARTTRDFTLTGHWQVLGTFHYMAPEQIENPLALDHRADIYSLGVMFYEMLTGGLPIGRFPLPSQKVKMDERIDEVVLKALEKEPEQRYQQVSELKAAIDELLGKPAFGTQSVTAPRLGATPNPVLARTSGLTTAEATSQMEVSKDRVRQRLKGLVLGLMVTGCIELILGFVSIFVVGCALIAVGPRDVSDVANWMFIAAIIGLLQGSVVIIGARQIRKLEAYQFVVLSSFVAMLPCSPAFPIGLPMGLWSLMSLRRQDVRAAFHGAYLEAKSALPLPSTSDSTTPDVTPQRQVSKDDVRQRLKGLAVGLMVTGCLGCLLCILCWGLAAYSWSDERSFSVVPPRSAHPLANVVVVAGIVGLLQGIVVIIGARQIQKLEAYQFVVFSCFLAMFPCSPAFLIGLPMGLWALMALRVPEVRAAFHGGFIEAKLFAGPIPKGRFKQLFATSTGWAMLICLIGCAVTFLPWVNAAHLGATIALSGYETRLGLLTGLAFLILLLLLVATGFIEPIPFWRPLALFIVGIGAIVFPLLLPSVLSCSLREGALIAIGLGLGLLFLGALQIRAILMRIRPPSSSGT